MTRFGKCDGVVLAVAAEDKEGSILRRLSFPSLPTMTYSGRFAT